MKIIGLLCWYEEDPEWLAEAVSGAARVCDHIVAVDGAYARFPGADKKPVSSPVQARTIQTVAAGAGVGCTVHVPRYAWQGNEIEKRNFMFRVGATFAEPNEDWFFVFDADEFVSDAPVGFKSLLKGSDLDVAEMTLWERRDLDFNFPSRRFFRAIPGIQYQQTHFVVTAEVAGETRILSGLEGMHKFALAENLSSVRMEHRTEDRTDMRKALKQHYYAAMPEFEEAKPL